MADYSANIAKADAKVRAKGMPMVFVRVEKSGEYDPVLNGYPMVETRVPVYGLKTSPTVAEVQGDIFAVGSMIVLMAGNAIPDVKTGDYLIFGGKKWNIKKIKAPSPAESVILYKLQVEDAGTIEEDSGNG